MVNIFPTKKEPKLIEGRIGIDECEIREDTGELVCQLSLVDQPSKKFLVTASPDSNNNVRITKIKSADEQPIPSDMLNEIKAVVTDLIEGKIPIEEI